MEGLPGSGSKGKLMQEYILLSGAYQNRCLCMECVMLCVQHLGGLGYIAFFGEDIELTKAGRAYLREPSRLLGLSLGGCVGMRGVGGGVSKNLKQA